MTQLFFKFSFVQPLLYFDESKRHNWLIKIIYLLFKIPNNFNIISFCCACCICCCCCCCCCCIILTRKVSICCCCRVVISCCHCLYSFLLHYQLFLLHLQHLLMLFPSSIINSITIPMGHSRKDPYPPEEIENSPLPPFRHP